MPRILKPLLFVFIVFTSALNAQNYIPTSSGEIINHTYYSLSYNEQHEQANWVYYYLDNKGVNGAASRSDNFRPDPKVSTGSAELVDYKGSGYDRGHIAPAADMKQNSTSMSESFYLSNMSPQHPSFNRGAWKKLEEQVRNWALDKNGIYVVSGPVFRNNIGTIGPNKVTVPGYYFKVLYDPDSQKMLALIMPNRKISQPLNTFIVSVDSVEAITNIDFFPQLEDSLENKLEGTINLAPGLFLHPQP